MKVLIADDEPLARQRLERFIEAIPNIELVGEAENGIDAISQVWQLQPDLILLDIRMPGMTGLEVARHLSTLEEPPAIIFCSAFDEYALDAIKVNAIDYLLKPVRLQDLESAIKQAGKINRVQAVKLMADEDESSCRSHISISSHRGLDLIPVADIRCFRAEQKYVVVHSTGNELLLDEPLKNLEEEFGDQFIRIHRNALVAIRYITGMTKNEEGQTFIKVDGLDMDLQISRRHLSAVRKRLQGL